MSVQSLERIFSPRSIALIGASERAGAVGAVTLRNLMRANPKAPLYLVNPRHGVIAGQHVYPDIAALPGVPDLAVIATPPETVPGLIDELGARGTKGAVVITAGFGELGARGQELQRQALATARAHGVRMIGPNCLGVMVPGEGLDASFSHIAPGKGDLAFVSQSGALITAVLDWAQPRGIGFSHIVSLGDMADVDFGDMIDYLATDTSTRAILLYVEGMTNARKFMSAARAAARLKPMVVVKVGRHAESARAARSHTGALAGSDAVYEAAFRRAGLLRVDTMAELFDAAETLALTGPQTDDRLTILTNGGGPGVLATDALIGLGGKLAALSDDTIAKLDKVLPPTWSRGNPVDIIGDASGERYRAALEILLAQPETGAILVLNCPTALGIPSEAAQAVVDAIAAHRSAGARQTRNVYASWLGDFSASKARDIFVRSGVASYDTPDDAVKGFMHRVRYARSQEALLETPSGEADDFAPDARRVGEIVGRALSEQRRWLDPQEIAAVFEAYGIPMAASRIVGTPEAAGEAAGAIGKPVALKIQSRDLTHKSDVGGVALDLKTADQVTAAARAMRDRIAAAKPDAHLEGFLVQEMVQRPGAAELIVGLVADRVFGPVVLFGQGGTAVELLNDSTLELPPLNISLARAQMARTRIWRLLQGYRGKPAADIDGIATVLVRVGLLAANHPEIAELDINPLLADADGVIAVDARIAVAAATGTGSTRLAIAPYPAQFAGSFSLPDGTRIALRPVRPEDETQLQDIVGHMSADDLHFRFLAAMTKLPHQMAARLTQIDYDREMALIAFPEAGGPALGFAQYIADPSNARAEYAIALRSDWKNVGLGYLLLQQLLDIARRRGVGEVYGVVENDNAPMLDVCRSLGFAISPDPEDRRLVRPVKSLAGSPIAAE